MPTPNTKPIFGLTPKNRPIGVAAANLASDGSGVINTLVTVGLNGGRLDAVNVKNAQTTQALSSSMLVKVWLSDINGVNFKMIGEELLASATRSATVKGANTQIVFSPAKLVESGQIIGFTQSIYASAADANSVCSDYIDF